MVLTTSQLILVAVIFLTAGTITTIGNKWLDMIDAADNSGKVSKFDHPFFQTAMMFVGDYIWQMVKLDLGLSFAC